MPLPILYSFRRCPYAMRARMALHQAGCAVELREVSLKHKPAALLACSAKGTVPVLVTGAGQVIEESLDIMRWALAGDDPDDWLLSNNVAGQAQANALIRLNDQVFKAQLDRYKYPERFPQHSAEHYREQGAGFLATLEAQLTRQAYLVSPQPSLADCALMPFVRQFAGVDPAWFAQSPYPRLQRWLAVWLASPVFLASMHKHPVWQAPQ
ncbi:glutathione S-transferase [Pseudomonas sp. 2FE]|uniref:glutathione S-transferase n=1 Tax=Pseudomonas sp. 2FE TaxID=2502190 RepID=UPI0010F5D05D|nr:glutathione S-transferase [Pseudomonas sp. 2FE]